MGDDLAGRLKRFALDALGFDLVGITTAEPLSCADRVREWVERGWHGEMEYMRETVDMRTAPASFLPGARAVVCVAASYHDAPEPPERMPRGGRAVVARYARRKDYHRVIKRRLVRLGRFLSDAAPGSQWRVAVDAEPVLERELAQRAGLGWVGKNTCLINRRLGSEILLGELITDHELPADEPGRGHCGTCTACLASCPTAAFRGAYRLDARRCISYLTIEHRSALSERAGTTIGGHLFGCDVCQAVCPWNRRPPVVTHGPLATRPGLVDLQAATLADLDEEAWRSLTAGSPMRRLDFSRFRRNLGHVLANLQSGSDGDPR